MEILKVQLDKVKTAGNELFGYRDKISVCQSNIETIYKNLRSKIVCEEQIGKRLRELSTAMEKSYEDMETMGEKLDTICYLYDKTEKGIAGSCTETVSYGNTKIFDQNGSYGGDQFAPAASAEDKESDEWKDLVAIIQNTYPNIKDPEETEALMQKLKSEGCGYVAMVNMIFIEYEGREKEFEEDFGFPMYKNGELNYNELLVDIYCRTDNHNKNWLGKDKYYKNEDYTYGTDEGDGFFYWLNFKNRRKLDETGNGQDCETMAYRMNLYMKEKGVDRKVKVENVELSPDHLQYTQLTDGKYVVVSAKNFELFNSDNSSATGGERVGTEMRHVMIVTGVTSDGRYIVSTNGGKFYLDPKECESMEFYAYS